MANARKPKVNPPNPEELKKERAQLVQTIGDEQYAVEVYKANIMSRCQRISEINKTLQSLQPIKAEQAQEATT